MQVGIIGQGFVGMALKAGFEKYYTTNTYDINGNCSCQFLSKLIDKSNIIFVCLPTPMKKDGSCDTSIVENTVMELDNLALTRQCSNRIVVIKSTIPPGTTEMLNEECEHIQVVFNPEFLTEANFIEDFKN